MKHLSLILLLAALCSGPTFAASMGTAFTYQGHLHDGGRPANGNYDLLFSLMDAATNGSPIGPILTLPNTAVSNGYFTVELDFGQNAFNGSARWVDIGVRTNCNCFANYTLLSPRQPLTPTPYALFAQTAFAALNAANVTDGAITSSKLAPGLLTWASLAGIPAGFADGVDNDTTYAAGAGLTLGGANNQFSVNFAGSGSAGSAARSDHHHFGAKWTGSTAYGIGLGVTNRSSTFAAGVFGQQGDGSGVPYLFGGAVAGVWGESSQGSGVYGASGYQNGSGVFGLAASTNGTATGVSGQSASTSGVGVRGLATTLVGQTFGVRGESASSDGTGIFGYATSTTGTNYGVFGKSLSSTGIGVYGLSGSASVNPVKADLGATSFGVIGESSQGFGVVGLSDVRPGVFGSSGTQAGVIGTSDGYFGVLGSSPWVGASGQSPSGTGVYAQSDTGIPLMAALRTPASNKSIIEAIENETIRFRVTGAGEVYAHGAFHPNGADFAEMLSAQNSLEPGDVLVIGEDGKLARCTQPYQENVAGVHATRPGLLGGAEDGADLTGKIPLAVVGVVPVKVTTENGSIKPGDKLTTSSTPGHAMKAGKRAEVGTVIGKALEGFDGQPGIIQMLVVLQ